MAVTPPSFSGLVVQQWLPDWDAVTFDDERHQSRPLPNFLLLSIPASTLRRLADTYRRDPQSGARADDTGIQRVHDEHRSSEISRYVREGYPLSTLSAAKRSQTETSLRKPGWLPTAIVVNILDPDHPHSGRRIRSEDALTVPPSDQWTRGESVKVGLPASWTEKGWEPEASHPIEVIDGQHRLWSFEGDDTDADFDLPVVAFYGLDISWQAYLFWTINIKPKKINASLAYDLYPLLRDQDWLVAGEGIDVYRETRSQELTEALWSHPESVWRDRINMLGETGVRSVQPVTQAAFVRSVSETFVRPWRSRSSSIGGLFGGASNGMGLEWSRAQQAAFLIESWGALSRAVEGTDANWARAIRDEDNTIRRAETYGGDAAFAGPHTLLSSDQGVRAFHQTLNALFYVRAQNPDALSWNSILAKEDVSDGAIRHELSSLRDHPMHFFIGEMASSLSKFDWRNSKAPGLTRDELTAKQALRGTGGYKILRERVLTWLAKSSRTDLAATASTCLELTQ